MGFDLVAKKPTSEQYSDFRFNVWGWRLPWNYICHFAHELPNKNGNPEIISASICRGGEYNDGTLVSSAQAKEIAQIIYSHDKDGILDELENSYEADRMEAKEHNKMLDKEMEKLKQKVEKETGTSGLAPINYPTKYRKIFDELQERRDWRSSYPFHKERMLQFAQFMEQSGGFEIW